MGSNVMDKLIKFNSQSAGRDKLFRLIQYSSRLIWAYLEQNNQDKDVINKLKNLEYSLSTARKLYRFGRSIDTFYSALKSIYLTDPTLRFTLTLSKINMALYLISDHIIWIGRMGLINVDNSKWAKINYKLWFYYLVMNLTRDVYEILDIIEKINFHALHEKIQNENFGLNNTFSTKLNTFYRFLLIHKDLVVDVIKNSCDVCLPLAQLGYLSLSPKTIGLLGMISSLVGMLPLLDQSYKLSPM